MSTTSLATLEATSTGWLPPPRLPPPPPPLTHRRNSGGTSSSHVERAKSRCDGSTSSLLLTLLVLSLLHFGRDVSFQKFSIASLYTSRIVDNSCGDGELKVEKGQRKND